ncbi:MAG: diaminopimelate epimerase [Planctomycetota bacterium]|nr:diaminopimelate epimerase [Planctomycetota bacterium]
MRFTKMHGAGNDYIFIDCFNYPEPRDPGGLAREMSDRHLGGDGLILIEPSTSQAARMRMFNADGSEAEMCGNGIRCVAKYLRDHQLTHSDEFTVETLAGPMRLRIENSNADLDHRSRSSVEVDMGSPVLNSSLMPTELEGHPPATQTLDVAGQSIEVTCVSMGNPHCVVFVEDLNDDWVLRIGPLLERHPAFPQRTNVEFARVVSANRIQARVWERGSGETMACGTGACAICVAGVQTQRSSRHVAIDLPGGTLELEWRASGHVFMPGPAVEVFSGHWPTIDDEPNSASNA